MESRNSQRPTNGGGSLHGLADLAVACLEAGSEAASDSSSSVGMPNMGYGDAIPVSFILGLDQPRPMKHEQGLDAVESQDAAAARVCKSPIAGDKLSMKVEDNKMFDLSAQVMDAESHQS